MASSLAEAIIYGSDKECLKIINSKTEDLNAVDEYGLTSLTQAIIKKNKKIFLKLLETDINVEQKDILGRTPLQWAVDRNELDFIKILLEHGADPNHYSLDGQPVLVNPILREQVELINLLRTYHVDCHFPRDFISAKLLGHRFELMGSTDIVNNKNVFIPLNFEGFYLEFSTNLLYRSLDNFLHSVDGASYYAYYPGMNKILRALKNCAQLASFAQHKDKTPFATQIDLILQEELLLLPSAFAGHAITFICYKNFFVKCDRGVNGLVDTVLIYKVNNPYLMTRELYEKILFASKTRKFIEKELKEILKLEIVTSLPTRSQLTGNCSWANVETSVVAMLYLLELNFNRKTIEELKDEVYKFYYAWIDWDKDIALNEAIAELENCNLARQISKANILGSILTQRLSFNKPKDCERARKILTILSREKFQFLLNIYITVHKRPAAGKVGEYFFLLLEKCKFNLQTRKLEDTTYTQAYNDSNPLHVTTALHLAASRGELENIKYLIEKLGLDVNYQDRTGSTALMYAACFSTLDTVRLLVEKYHANINIVNLQGGTALRYAQTVKKANIVAYLRKFNK